jgi:hypothetical protein
VSSQHLPPEWRIHPVVIRADLDRLTERVDEQSHPSKSATPRLDPVTLRLLILGLCILTASGVIRPEALLKMLPAIIKLALGVGV